MSTLTIFQEGLLAAFRFARLPVRVGTSGFGLVPKLTGLKVGLMPVLSGSIGCWNPVCCGRRLGGGRNDG